MLDHPHNLLLLDAAGALFSALMLGGVLVYFQTYVGIPPATLYLLAAIPLFFLAFDVLTLLAKPDNYALPLRVIGTLNVGYCLLSISLAIYHRNEITALGTTYLAIEILVVLLVAYLEFKTAASSKNSEL